MSLSKKYQSTVPQPLWITFSQFLSNFRLLLVPQIWPFWPNLRYMQKTKKSIFFDFLDTYWVYRKDINALSHNPSEITFSQLLSNFRLLLVPQIWPFWPNLRYMQKIKKIDFFDFLDKYWVHRWNIKALCYNPPK